MGLSEKMIQNKISEISDSYMMFTEKSETWRYGISLADYQVLRMQAIMELEKGMINSDHKEESVKINTAEPVREQQKIREEPIVPKQEETVKEDKVISYQSHMEVKQDEPDDSIMKKFAMLKDL